MDIGAFAFVSVSFSAAAAMTAFAIYQYRRGATFTLKNGWRSRDEYPVAFCWGIFATMLVALMFVAPGLTFLMGP